jgi:SAM-dependent methyltransferase
MGWRFKSAQIKLLSLLPGGSRLYHYTQENITRTTVATRTRVAQKLSVGLEFWAWLQQQECTEQLTGGNLLDLGAGWHPTIPLLWYAFGNSRQTLVDVFPNMDARKVTDTIRLFREIVGDAHWPGRASLKRLPEARPKGGAKAGPELAPFGIEYRAPYGNLLPERAGQYDMVICTQVLYYLPKPVQLTIFKEVHTCLKPGGLFHATAHFVAQFRSPDVRLGQYEHLSYSQDMWENRINSSLLGFNRLKGPDYRELLEQAGFGLSEFKLTGPTAEDLAELKRTRVHPFFSRYSEQDLAARGVFFVAKKP